MEKNRRLPSIQHILEHSCCTGVLQGACIELSKTNVVAVDLAESQSDLYYVSEFGRAYRVTASCEEQEEIVLHEDASNCIHGYVTSSHRTSVRKIAANSMG